MARRVLPLGLGEWSLVRVGGDGGRGREGWGTNCRFWIRMKERTILRKTRGRGCAMVMRLGFGMRVRMLAMYFVCEG